VRCKRGELGTLKNKILPPALAFGARDFLTFFDDVPFTVADDADHFDVPAFPLLPERQASGCLFLLR
jgi:hypothetical protein